MQCPTIFIDEVGDMQFLNLNQSTKYKGFTITKRKTSFIVRQNKQRLFSADFISNCKHFIDDLIGSVYE